MELMDMPFKKYYCLYRAAWLESEARAAEMEAAEKKEKQETAKANKTSKNNKRLTQHEVLDQLHSLSTTGDIEDVVEELM